MLLEATKKESSQSTLTTYGTMKRAQRSHQMINVTRDVLPPPQPRAVALSVVSTILALVVEQGERVASMQYGSLHVGQPPSDEHTHRGAQQTPIIAQLEPCLHLNHPGRVVQNELEQIPFGYGSIARIEEAFIVSEYKG